MSSEGPKDSFPDSQEPAPIQLKIWELAWPSILGNLLFSIIGIISIKIVGSLGSEAVAAVTTGHRLFFRHSSRLDGDISRNHRNGRSCLGRR
jgi:Na+-driven multidrug efflux pump